MIGALPVALVSLFDAHRQWFKVSLDMDVQEVARDIAVCAQAFPQPEYRLIVKGGRQN